MYTPPVTDVFRSVAAVPVGSGFLRSMGAQLRPVPLYIDSSDRWTTTCPSAAAPAYAISHQTFALLAAGGHPPRRARAGRMTRARATA